MHYKNVVFLVALKKSLGVISIVPQSKSTHLQYVVDGFVHSEHRWVAEHTSCARGDGRGFGGGQAGGSSVTAAAICFAIGEAL